MRSVNKKAVAFTAAFALLPAAAAAPAMAAESPEGLVFSHGENTFSVSWGDYANLIVNGEGNMYDLVQDSETSIKGVKYSGSFVDYNEFVNAIVDAEDGMSSIEVLDDIHANADVQMSEDTVDSIVENVEFDENGEPIFGDEGPVPEVIDIY
ncbi:hypothetical protein [Salimicrobium halophilum]|uniref:Uncharacterized protein n=1 Tax=Salimicrobium halophilum TaxID=86666 RepID=A0A1G8SEG5_9BACI|nr:hypothetical protein [Salimicrobium halophilum]SDJ27652.1 hypothetical protein SAMN04490247_1417 [Salimicrobium halophilum]